MCDLTYSYQLILMRISHVMLHPSTCITRADRAEVHLGGVPGTKIQVNKKLRPSAAAWPLHNKHAMCCIYGNCRDKLNEMLLTLTSINTFFSISAHINNRTYMGEKLSKEALFYVAIWAITSTIHLLSTVFPIFQWYAYFPTFPLTFQTSGGGRRTSWWQKQETDGCMRRP